MKRLFAVVAFAGVWVAFAATESRADDWSPAPPTFGGGGIRDGSRPAFCRRYAATELLVHGSPKSSLP